MGREELEKYKYEGTKQIRGGCKILTTELPYLPRCHEADHSVGEVRIDTHGRGHSKRHPGKMYQGQQEK